MKLWDKGHSIDEKIEAFTVGNDREIDLHIAYYDLLATRAHSEMLHRSGFFNADEWKKMSEVIDAMLDEVQAGEFVIEQTFEDVHSKIEHVLVNTLGDLGKRVHTARSRNDQVLVALQLYYKDQITNLKKAVKVLFDQLLTLAEAHKDDVLPGYTHLQVAMPSSFGLWFSAYAEVLIDDMELLQSAYRVVDQNPLGSAAGYGSSFPIDRRFTTDKLNFSTLKFNVVAAQLGRGKCERVLAGAISNLANTVGRMAMDICLYMSRNFGFVKFPDAFTTGSSIMPHKKNPDVFELVRATCNKIQALPHTMVLLTNNLPSGYHRDFQLLKEPVISACMDMNLVMDIMSHALPQIEVLSVDLDDEKYRYIFSVDRVNTLIQEGMSFREAYQLVGKEIESGTYTSPTDIKHSHVGSMHNLCLEDIKTKFPIDYL